MPSATARAFLPQGRNMKKHCQCILMLLHPLGERLGEGVMQDTAFAD